MRFTAPVVFACLAITSAGWCQDKPAKDETVAAIESVLKQQAEETDEEEEQT